MAVVGDKRAQLQKQLESEGKTDEEAAHLQADLEAQYAKRQQWKLENQRRRHNYVPLCVELLKELARKDMLPQLISEAGERVRAKVEKKKSK
jgi:ubiquitin carboxyl-terminal hydrolase L5